MNSGNAAPQGRDTLQNNPDFLLALGFFYAHWTSTDMTIDYAIGKFLKLPAEDAQRLTAGMLFGPKIRILSDMVKRSDHKNKAAIIGALNRLQNQAKRNVFAHSYLLSNADSVMFLERPGGGEYRVRPHRYTLPEWQLHVRNVMEAASELWEALDSSPEEFHAFAETAFNSAHN